MADKKISELTNLTGANLASDDELVIVDTSATETKAITYSELSGAITATLVDSAPATLDTLNELAAALGDDPNFATTVTNSIATKVSKSGDSMTGNLSFGDNDKAIFGAGSDLQIYHDTLNSYIKDAGTGVLNVQGSSQVNIGGANGTIGFQFVEGANASLRHNNALKLTTTSTGIDVTGTVTADGLTVDGNRIDINLLSVGGGIDFNYNGGSSSVDVEGSFAQAISVKLDKNDSSSFGYFEVVDGSAERNLLKVEDHGDISFYEDTGTTAKFFWDASAESLGIGTTSPNELVQIKGSANGGGITLQRSSTTANDFSQLGFLVSTNDAGTPAAWVRGLRGTSANLEFLTFGTSNTERMRIDSSGSVGIGTSSPDALLHVESADGGDPSIYVSTADNSITTNQLMGRFAVYKNDPSGGGVGVTASIDVKSGTSIGSTSYMTFGTDSGALSQERMRIDSSGNLLVGTTAVPTDDNTALGFGVTSSGEVRASVNGSNAAMFKRATSDGDIVEFRKDSSTVGSIGTGSSLLTIGTGTGNLLFDDALVAPAGSSSAGNSNGVVDLGSSGRRFKDLYLSGGVYLGGTGASNKLDDYEEGTFDPTATASVSGSWTPRSGFSQLRYTKVGSLVTITGQFEVLGSSSPSGNIEISLPFSIRNDNDSRSATAINLVRNGSSLATTPFAYFTIGVDYFNIALFPQDGVSGTNLLGSSQLDSAWEFTISASYHTEQ